MERRYLPCYAFVLALYFRWVAARFGLAGYQHSSLDSVQKRNTAVLQGSVFQQFEIDLSAHVVKERYARAEH